MELILLIPFLALGALAFWDADTGEIQAEDAPEADPGPDMLADLTDAPLRLDLSDDLGAEVTVSSVGEDASVQVNGETVLTYLGASKAEAAANMEALAASGAFAA